MKMIEKSDEMENDAKMAWNEPDGDKKDPWGSRDNKSGGGGGDQSPPDLDEVVKNMQNKIAKLFGGKGGSGGNGGESGGGGGISPSSSLIGVIVGILFVVWLASGIYIIEPEERGVVLRFGAYVDTTQPGPHWHIPYPVERVEIVNVDQIRDVEVGYRSAPGRSTEATSVPQEALMLTQDENIVDIKFAVQYRVKDAKHYLFSVRDPHLTLREATESAIREAIGKSKMDFVLTQGQSDIAERTEKLIQEILDRYKTGLQVTSVNLQSAQPPQEVKGAFEDAIKAREDNVRLKNDAQAYANDIIPKARGKAARQLEEANAYKARVVAQAEGESKRFTDLLAEYEKAPEVTRDRLYLDTLEAVMGNTSKVLVDVEGSNNLLYLPLDKIIGKSTSETPTIPDVKQFVPPPPPTATQQSNVERRLRDTLRNRGVR